MPESMENRYEIVKHTTLYKFRNILENQVFKYMLKSQEFHKEYPEQNIQDRPMFRFDLCHTSEGLQNHRIVELENAFLSKSEEVIHLRTEMQHMETTQNKLQQRIQEQQQDYELIRQDLVADFERKQIQYQKFIELKRINEILSHENSLYRSIERMKEFK